MTVRNEFNQVADKVTSLEKYVKVVENEVATIVNAPMLHL